MKIKTFVVFFMGGGYKDAFEKLDKMVHNEMGTNIKIHSVEDKLFPSKTSENEYVDASPKLVRVIIYD